MSKIIGRPLYAPAPAGGGKPSAPKFTYDGDYVIRDDGVVELLTSGTIVFLEPKVIDLFMVGGGGCGGRFKPGEKGSVGYGGGAGGYTRTLRRVTVSGTIEVEIGAGGVYGDSTASGNGKSTHFGTIASINGGQGHNSGQEVSVRWNGSDGGSGGGGGVKSNSDYGTGGSNGNPGENGYPNTCTGGAGQGFTTREFGEATGKLYAGAGGGGRYMVSSFPVISSGGTGGGGAGGWSTNDNQHPAGAGVANTGGGGGGGAAGPSLSTVAENGTGGSGIVCFREAAELPELAGTWVLNERLYMPERYFTENVRFTGVQTGIQGSVSFVEAQFYYARGTKRSLLRFAVSSSNIKTIYDFTENKWSEKYQTITFLPSATASDEFRAWLVSNATKQTA